MYTSQKIAFSYGFRKFSLENSAFTSALIVSIYTIYIFSIYIRKQVNVLVLKYQKLILRQRINSVLRECCYDVF